MRKAGMTTTYLDLAVRLFGRARARPPSAIFYFRRGRVLFNAVTMEVVIANTVIDLRDLVRGLAERKKRNGSSGRATVNRYIAEVFKSQKPAPRPLHGRGA